MPINTDRLPTSPSEGKVPGTASIIQQIGAHYQRPAGQSYHESQFTITPTAEQWVMRMRASKFQRFIQPGDTVAEYGVGHGWNLARLQCGQRIGFDIGSGVEPVVSAHGIKFAPVWEDIKEASVNVVICHHVLEHVPQPLETLAAIRRVLVPGGTFLLIIPHETEKWLNEYNENEPNRHLYSWNVQSIGNLVHLSGFDILESSIRRYGYDRAAALWAQRVHLGERGFHAIRSAALMVRARHEIYLVAKAK